MLYIEGYTIWLVAVVGTLIIASVIALLSHDHSARDSVTPIALSDEDRVLLQATAVQNRKKQSDPDAGSRRKLRQDQE